MKTALITGASGGIGYELARVFAKNSYDLIIVGRDEQRLRTAAEVLYKKYGRNVITISRDLSRPGTAKEVFDAIVQKGISVDVLINNAGMGKCGPFSESDDSLNMEMIQLNIASLTQLTYYFLQPMFKRRSGTILNVASTGAYQAGPYIAVYYATKAFVLSFTEALSCELKGSGITVSALCPGATATNFAKTAGKKDLKGAMSSGKVAQAAYNGALRGRGVIIPGAANKIGIILSKFMPRNVSAKIIGKSQYRLYCDFWRERNGGNDT